MPRFVILEHASPRGRHWDFMLERGDALVLAGAFAWGLHVIAVGHASESGEIMATAMLQYLWAAALSLICAALSGESFGSDLALAAGSVVYAGAFTTAFTSTVSVYSLV